MPFDPNVHVGAAAWIERGESVLLMKRSAAATHGRSTWALPGGWVDGYESPREAIVREIEEEIGVITDKTYCELLDVVTNTYQELGTVVCVVYRVVIDDFSVPAILEPEKADALMWVHKDFLHDTMLAGSHVNLFPALRALLMSSPELI